MLITGKEQLQGYCLQTREWQGIPGVAVTKGGRIFVCFYSGAKTEDLGNYCALIKSDDGGQTWSEPIAVAYFGEQSRAYDPCVWIDPNGKLWFYYSVCPAQKVYAVTCDNPDAAELAWSEEFEIGGEVLLNKPTVMKNGEWWFPSAVWGKTLMDPSPELKDVYKVLDEREVDRKAFVFVTKDGGKTFEKRGGVAAGARSFDEHQFLELLDGRVAMYIRTTYGIGASYSSDGGYTWTEAEDTGIFSPNTRFYITRLASGNILLISHQKSDNPETPNMRTKLTAFLSKDDGKTFEGGLLLDNREAVSYPDGQVLDGEIYIIYDRDRRGAGEIILAKFTEADILAKQLQGEGYLQKTVIKLEKAEA